MSIAARREELTSRELEVCELLLAGLQTRAIAAELGISPSTVEKHRLKVFEKIGADSVPMLIHEMSKFIADVPQPALGQRQVSD